MRKTSIIFLFVLLSFMTNASVFDDRIDGVLPVEYDQGFVHPYGMISYKNMILVSNFGSEILTEEKKNGQGFISAIQGGVVKTFIRPDGHLIAPKGMAIYDNLLFVADINKLVVYNLKKVMNPPVEIIFPENEVTLTDVEVVGDMLLVSVNNTGNIYGVDFRRTPVISKAEPILLAHLDGAAMMDVSGTKLYVNSFTSEISDSSLLYVADLTSQSENPFEPFCEKMVPGQYLGLHITEDGHVYISALKTQEMSLPMIYYSEIDSKEPLKIVDIGFKLVSPTSILVFENNIWITDYVESKAYRFEIK